jgi:hypothetical protein
LIVPRDCVARNAALTSFAACSGALRRNKPLHQLACRPQAAPATVKPVGERRIHGDMKTKTSRFARPRWSLKSSFYTAVGIVALVTPLVLLTIGKSIWTELEILTLVISALMFIYLTAVLYLGVRFNKNERFAIEWPKGDPADIFDASLYFPGDTGGFFTGLGAEAGILGAIIGFILDVVATLILAYAISLLLWIGFNGVAVLVPAVGLPLFFFYRRALRAIVLKGRRCQGKPGRSMLHALKSTLGYAVWFYGIFMLAHHIQRFRMD